MRPRSLCTVDTVQENHLGEEVTNLFVVDFEVARPDEVLNVVGQRYLVEYVLRQEETRQNEGDSPGGIL